MIPLNEAISLALNYANELKTENIDFTKSIGRILAEDIFSDIDIPSFNKSAMDGYALRKEDINQPLTVVQTVQAGDMPIAELKPTECVKIMTGARLPNNADYVAKIEDTETDPTTGKVYIRKIENKSNIRYQAEDIRKNQRVLCKGTIIRPQEVATLATVGKTSVLVYQKPTVAIASTGNELVEPHQSPADYQIRNSNAFQLLAQCQQIHIHASYEGIIPDDENITYNRLKDISQKNDVVILTGGVSMGDFDFVPTTIEKLGYQIVFKSISVQPGKPTMMATKGNKYIFGLPGNPVSSFIQFELIVKPFLYKLMGHAYQAKEIPLPLAHEYRRKKAERTSLVPVKIEQNKVIAVEYHGSAHLFALNEAVGIIRIEPNVTHIEAGTYVTVRFF